MIKKQKQKQNYGNKTTEYSIIKSKRVKTSEITVDKDEVIIRTPFNKSTSEIRKIIQQKAPWILKKQLEHKDITPQIRRPEYQDDSTLSYLGKNYRLRIIKIIIRGRAI